MINDPQLLKFVNESVRTTADLLAGHLSVPGAVLDAVAGQGLAAALGTTNAELLSAEPWEPANMSRPERHRVPPGATTARGLW